MGLGPIGQRVATALCHREWVSELRLIDPYVLPLRGRQAEPRDARGAPSRWPVRRPGDEDERVTDPLRLGRQVANAEIRAELGVSRVAEAGIEGEVVAQRSTSIRGRRSSSTRADNELDNNLDNVPEC